MLIPLHPFRFFSCLRGDPPWSSPQRALQRGSESRLIPPNCWCWPRGQQFAGMLQVHNWGKAPLSHEKLEFQHKYSRDVVSKVTWPSWGLVQPIYLQTNHLQSTLWAWKKNNVICLDDKHVGSKRRLQCKLAGGHLCHLALQILRLKSSCFP